MAVVVPFLAAQSRERTAQPKLCGVIHRRETTTACGRKTGRRSGMRPTVYRCEGSELQGTENGTYQAWMRQREIRKQREAAARPVCAVICHGHIADRQVRAGKLLRRRNRSGFLDRRLVAASHRGTAGGFMRATCPGTEARGLVKAIRSVGSPGPRRNRARRQAADPAWAEQKHKRDYGC